MSISAPNIDNLGVYRRNPNSSTVHGDAARGIAVVERMTFLESHATAAGTTTNYCTLPPGAILIDIVVTAEALHTGTSSSLNIGDGDDPDGYFTTIDLKATDLLAEQSVRLSGNLATAGGVIGAYGNVGTNTHLTDIGYPDGGVVSAAVTYGATPLDAGITHVDVIFAVPYVTFGTFVAS